jgi:hypothetical protein
MHDRMTFEARLADAFERYVANAPVEVDAVALATHVVSKTPRRILRWLPWTLASRRRLAAALVVGLLVLALTATVLFLIGRLPNRPLPWVYRNELVTAPDLLVPRAFTEAITLHDGRVLILGGDNSSLPTAEIFDPAEETMRRTGSLVSPRFLSIGRTALLRDGRVLVLGDNRPAEGPQTANVQIFDPRTLEFHPVGPLVTPRTDAWIGVLRDGRALVIGGFLLDIDSWTPDDVLMDVEAFDPETNTFSNVASLPHPPADAPSVTSLPDGRVVVFGRLSVGDGAISSILEVFDPDENTFSETGQQAVSPIVGSRIPANAAAEVLADGRLFIIGEAVAANGSATAGGAVIWDPATDTFVGGLVAAPWVPSRLVHLDDGRVLMIGPADGSNSRLSGARTYDPRTNASVNVGPLSGCLPRPVRLLDGRVLLIGGMEDCEIHRPELGGQLAPAVRAMQLFE